MAYLLLWIANLAAALLLVATLLACLGRLRSRKVQRWISAVAVFGMVLFYALFWLTLWAIRRNGLITGYTLPIGLLAGGVMVGSVLLRWRALRTPAEDERPAAARWPLLVLLPALLLAVVAQGILLWRLSARADQLMAEASAEGSRQMVSIAPPQVPAEENAALLYLQVIAELGYHTEFSEAPPEWEEAIFALGGETINQEPLAAPFDFAQPAVVAHLEELAPQLELLRQAAALPHCRFERNWSEPSYSMELPELNFMVRAARMLMVDVQYQVTQGNFETALADVNAMFAMANHAAREPCVVSVLIGFILRGMAFDSLKTVLAAGPIEEQALHLPAMPPEAEPMAAMQRALRGEQAFGLAVLGEADTAAFLQNEPDKQGSPLVWLYKVFLLPADLAEFRERSQQAADAFALPLEEAEVAVAAQEQEPPQGVITKIVLVDPLPYFASCRQQQSQQRTAAAAVALARYQARHGQMPETIEQLTPEFLPAWPTDPYDDQPVRVDRGEEVWTVYTLGPDGEDNGGHEIDWSTNSGDIGVSLGVWGEAVSAEP